MFRSILAYRHRGVVAAVAAVALTVPSTLALTGAFAASSASPQHTAALKQQFAQHLLKLKMSQYRTWPAQLALEMAATGSRSMAQQNLFGSPATQPATNAPQAAGPLIPSAGLPNVRVNNPGEDTHGIDQTTQSETAIAVHGSHVAVGFNDSQTTGLGLTAGSDLTGYAYSTNGGASFTDGGALPNAPQLIGFGDPWLGSDRTGTMYFSQLALNGFTGNLQVTVSKSANGGKTWGTPVAVDNTPPTTFESGDKDALAVGRDPVVATRDDIYVAYDDSVFDSVTGTAFNGLPVAHSTDGGKTWHLVYADKFVQPTSGCSFEQYIGATPIVNPANGTLYVTAEQISTNDPNCVGAPTVFSEFIFKSTNGGVSFGPGVKIANVTPAEPDGELHLGPGRYARTIEFPSPALIGNSIYVAWNDGASGHSHIRLAKSINGGVSWSTSFVNSGSNEDVQPSLSATTNPPRIHVLYYHRNANNTLDVLLSDSANGTTWTTHKVNTVTFRGTLTIPQFDPIIATGYMGDYVANIAVGSHLYLAWGDNRDTVKDFLFPQGRNDPDVFFAKR